MKHENLADSFSDFNTPWEGKTGMAVEDFITRNLIKSGSYDTEKETLSLVKGDDSTIDITVSVQTPTYLYGIINYGVRVDGTVYNGNELLMQYRDGRKVELGIAIQSVADRSGMQATVQKPFSVTIKFNNNSKVVQVYPISHEYFKTEGGSLVLNFPEDVNPEEAVVWVDVTEMFKRSFKDKTFETSFRQLNSEGLTETFKNTLATSITNEVINLTYSGSTIINNTSIDLSYEPSSTDRNNYQIVGFIGDKSFKLNKGDVTITGLQPGLNQISAQAVNVNNSDIYTDWFTVDIICAEGLRDTVVAVNGVSSGITNNGVATLYEMTVYSPNMEEVEIITYLEDGEPGDNPTPTNVVKQEILDPSSYNIETSSKQITYKKYIEIDSTNASKYLLVKVNGAFYKFYIAYTMDGQYYCYSALFKEMEVEAINTDYVYTKTYPAKFNFDQIGGYINNVFVTDAYATASQPANIKSTIEPSDGWHENEGRSYFKVSAQKDSIFTKPLELGLGTDFTLEFGVKTYNVSDIDKPILTLGKLQIRPTEVCWDLDRLATDDDATYQSKYLARVSKFQEGVETHIVITLNSNWTMPKDAYYPDYLADNQSIFDGAVNNIKMNLLRIYINGVIDREIKLEDSEVTALRNSTLDINPTTSDIDFYLFRVYANNSLDFSELIKNYISFLPNKTGVGSKEDIFNKNDILGDDGTVSWERCQGKVNTLLYIFPDGGRFPNRFWGGEDGSAEEGIDKKKHTALFINYTDPIVNAQYGGRLNHLQVKGQGSSAMRYLIWNVSSSMKKLTDAEDNKINSMFTPMGLLYPDSIPENYTAIESLKELKNCYHMPPYSGQVDTSAPTYNYKKMVGKVNYASSMQSHKIGACKLFDDAYKTMKSLPSGGLKAVHEEPYLYFYAETSLTDDEVSNLTWEQVLQLTDQIKFMGFQTWGPGKGDDAASGYDEDLTPEYLMLEGGENGDNSVNFLVPWHALQRLTKEPGTAKLTAADLDKNPVINGEASLAAPWDKLLIDDESVVYREKGAWDIDYGCEEVEEDIASGIMAGYFKFADSTHESLKKFREFYDFVYMTDFTFVYCDSTVTAVDPLTWDTNKKYLITATTFSIDGVKVASHEKYDMYRYDAVNETWVPAGLYYDPATGKWDRLNIRNKFYGKEFTTQSNQQAFRNYVKNLFMNGIKEYVDTDDISFHQAFIKYLSGTDNRAKNTYFQIIGPVYRWVDEDAGTKELIEAVSDYKIRLIGDDLDTILATDNNGLQSKAYNLIEDSYDEAYADVWGDLGNIFFRMYDVCFEDDIRAKLKIIMDKAGLNPSAVNNKGTYFYNTFFKVQEDFPAIAYNHTARIYYENADVIKAVGQSAGSNYDFDYKHNNVNPIEQSHGSSLECERQFMKERVAYLAGYALSCLDNTIKTSSGSGGGGVAMRLLLEFEPFQDFYPSYDYGTTVGSYKNFGELSASEALTGTYEALQGASVTKRYVAEKGKQYSKALVETSPAINQVLNQVNLFKSLSITGLLVDKLEGNFERTTTFEIDNNKVTENEDIFGKDWKPLNITNNSANLPVVQNLSLKHMSLGDTLDLSSYYKLQTLDLTGSTTYEVVFPQTGNLSSVIIPASVNTFRIYSNPGFTSESVMFEDIENLETIYIDCSKCGTFDVTDFCEKLENCSKLKSVDLRNAKNLNITEKSLQKLISCEHCMITGTVNIVKSKEDLTLYDISFSLKQDLVKLFGDIDSDSNTTKFNYHSSTIINVKTVAEVYVFGTPGEYPGLFPLTIDAGNDVVIENGRLKIEYTMERGEGGAFTNIASLSKDGVITLIKESETVTTKVRASVTTKTGVKNTDYAIVHFSWKAPSLGEFAYADGSFSSAYDSNKTVVGLVYAVDATSDTEGTVHILGKEYFGTPKYLGYTSDGIANDANSIDSSNMYRVRKFLEDKLAIVESEYSIVGTAQAPNYIKDGDKTSRVNVGDYTDFTTNYFTGKADTAKYIINVSKVLQALLSKDGSTLINYIEQKEVDLYGEKQSLYMPKNKAAFEYLITTYLPSLPQEDTFLVDTDMLASILYPHFYSVYYYEPTVNSYETLDPQYAAGNWYAPSAAELARIVYYRGYSAAGSNFIRDEEQAALEAPISKTITNGKTPQTTPIFSLAANSMTMPSVWTALLTVSQSGEMRRIGVNVTTTEYTTLTNNVFFNYLYSWSGTSFYGWYHGYNPKGATGVDGNSLGAENYWRARKQVGLPLVQYKYSKPV